MRLREFLAPVILTVLLAAPASAECWATAETQAELASCACSERETAASRLRAQLERLKTKHETDPEVLALLAEAERRFEAFRSAHSAALLAAHGGSAALMCSCLAQASVSSAYARELAPKEEGDMCSW